MSILKSIHKFRIPINRKQIKLAVKRYGLRKLPRLVYERFYDIWFDKKYGTDTVSLARLEDLDVGENGQRVGNQYQPSGLILSRQVLKQLQKNGCKHVVDFGSGKGQVLLQAEMLGFKTVHGVEFSNELHAIAELNFERFQAKRRKAISAKSFNEDAREYKVNEEMDAFYFFNPFKPFVLEKVLENIESSLVNHPREAVVAYLYPEDKHVFDKRPNWRVEQIIQVSDYDCIFYTYQKDASK